MYRILTIVLLIGPVEVIAALIAGVAAVVAAIIGFMKN
jgi:hypothetical protein